MTDLEKFPKIPTDKRIEVNKLYAEYDELEGGRFSVKFKQDHSQAIQ